MRNVSGVRVLAGWFAFGFATVLGQGCGSNPGTVGGGSGAGGRTSITINLGLGGQSSGLGGQPGIRIPGSGGIAADAASGDVPAGRKDARAEGTGSDVQGAPPTRTDGAQVGTASLPDAWEGADRATTSDLAAKEAKEPKEAKETGVRDTAPVMDAGAHLDVGAPDEPAPGIDGAATTGLDAAAASECSYGGRTYAVGDSFPNDCNACFCLASGEVVCTVKACSVDGGTHGAVAGPSERTGLLRRRRPLAT